jgi:hypothetical protein
MVMSSCKDNDEKETDYPIRPIPVENVIQGNNQLIAVTGDTVTIKWSAGFVFGFGIDWLEWWYDDNNQKSYTTISEMMETTINNDTIDGGWFKISPTRLSGRFCEEIRVMIDSNATGKRRALYIKPATAMFAPAYVFQECEDQMPQELKVLEINDSEMRCLSDVFNQQWAPDAVKGLYVFKKVK